MVENMFGIGIAVFAISGGFAIAFYAMWLDSRKRAMRHQEHMAMIEKGLVPANAAHDGQLPWSSPAKSIRGQRRSGVFMICLGIGLSIMFGLGRGWQNVWIGGFIAMIGVASLVNALLDDRDLQRDRRQTDGQVAPR